jgi:hypothetical protein
MLEKETDVTRWPVENQTILTAIAELYAQLDDTEKFQL